MTESNNLIPAKYQDEFNDLVSAANDDTTTPIQFAKRCQDFFYRLAIEEGKDPDEIFGELHKAAMKEAQELEAKS